MSLPLASQPNIDLSQVVKCVRCTYRGRQDSFPRNAHLQFLKTCTSCLEKQSANRSLKKMISGKENIPQKATGARRRVGEGRPSTLAWEEFVVLLSKHKGQAVEFSAFVKELSQEATEPREDLERAKAAAKAVWDATGYRFKYVI